MDKAPLRTPVHYSLRDIEVRLVTLRDVQENIDVYKTPVGIRCAIADMVQEAMVRLEAAEKKQTPPPTPR
jgi:hypothetical protein